VDVNPVPMMFGILMQTGTPAATESNGFKALPPLLLVAHLTKPRRVAKLANTSIRKSVSHVTLMNADQILLRHQRLLPRRLADAGVNPVPMMFGILMQTDTPAATELNGYKALTPLLLVVRIAKLRLVARSVKKNFQEIVVRVIPMNVVVVPPPMIAVQFAMASTPSNVPQMNLGKSNLAATPVACATMPLPWKKHIHGTVSVLF
jgi:hypothetical protein